MQSRIGAVVLGLVVSLVAVAPAREDPWPGEASSWRGFERHEFDHDWRACFVTVPKMTAAGRPWVWRARFPEYHPEVDVLLLEQGYHVAHVDTAGMLGSERALRHWDSFYARLTGRHRLARKAALEAVSRGGLVAYRWAARNPERVACIYADTPVCDIKSWPLGQGQGRGHAATWQGLLAEYGFSEAEALAFDGNPIDLLEPLARADVPLLHVVSASDEIVPVAENTAVLRERYEALGGRIEVLTVPAGTPESGGHHFPHPDPGRCADFVVRHTLFTPGDQRFLELRDGLAGSLGRLSRGPRARVAFLGGSITHNPGWRDLVGRELQRRFPDTDFEWINAGIPSMGSTPGAFRLARDVFTHGPIDLLFVEAAVNDAANGRSRLERLRAMEGIVRHVRRHDPTTDLVMLHFVDPGKMRHYRDGERPPEITDHERVAAHYGIPSIDLAREVTERIDAGEFTWEEDFRDLHPSPFGQLLYYRAIKRLLDRAWSSPPPPGAETWQRPLPEVLDRFCYDRGRLVAPEAAELETGFDLDPRWRPKAGGTRPGFVDVTMAVAERPGATLRLRFRGRAVGIFVAAGPDAGVIEARIDGGPPRRVDLFTRWSGRLHLPWAHVLGAELPGGEHELELTVLEENDALSRGHACRIAWFLVND